MDEKYGVASTYANQQTTERGRYVEIKAGIRSNTVLVDRLLAMDRTRQRRLMSFFNYEDEMKLSLVVEGHSPQQQSFEHYCSGLKHANRQRGR